jgi:hypothetical protein
MPTVYQRQIDSALALITRKGQTVTFVRGTGAYNPVSGTFAAGSITWTAKAVRLTNYKGIKFESMDDSFKQALVIGKAIGLLVPAKDLAYAPEPGDVITLVDNTTWDLVGSTVLSPDGTPILYTLGATKR